LPNVLLIPAYRPGPELPLLLEAIGPGVFAGIIVVDDGSGPEYAAMFQSSKSIVLRHEKNLGKGAALRTGMTHVLEHFPDCGVVTADADGQHHPDDVIRVAGRLEREPRSLVMGARGFDGEVPGRSRVGNRVARGFFKLLLGQTLRDTQTGLRGIPSRMLPELVAMKSDRYEFEVDMLTAAKHLSIPIVEEPVRTIYEPGNPTSHFNPLLDSMRIGFVLARFTMLSLATAVLDNLVFTLAIRVGLDAAAAQLAARAIAICINYPLARRAVFLSKDPHRSTLPRYLLLVAASGFLAFQLLVWFEHAFALDVLQAKILAESALFIVNFIVQRDWVFVRRSQETATDWDNYYRSPAPTAHLTRRYTGRVVVGALRKFGGKIERLAELGGANSCFLEKIQNEIAPREYHVIDTNAYGLSLLRDRHVVTHQDSCLDLHLELQADVVFSIGLIEHFDPAGTRKAVASHFALVKPGGCAIISYPTPTWLYRAARWLVEAAGMWQFPDERPLDRSEVEAAAREFGRVEFEKILWPIVFTQRLVVFRKNP
jgi:putative flippase GtrA/SAM-dependent methyltransferase